MLIVYAVAGVLVLVFLIRRFVRHRQTLEQYRDERERHAESVLASIRHENVLSHPRRFSLSWPDCVSLRN